MQRVAIKHFVYELQYRLIHVPWVYTMYKVTLGLLDHRLDSLVRQEVNFNCVHLWPDEKIHKIDNSTLYFDKII